MTTPNQPRGSRETYDRLSDATKYWAQMNAQPIREPLSRPPRAEEQDVVLPSELPENHPYRELSPDWQDSEEEETRLAELLHYEDDKPLYVDQREERTDRHRIDGYDEYRRDRYDDDRRDRDGDKEELDAQERFGGVNWGAGFFGWLVAVGFTLFLLVLVGVGVMVLKRAVPAVATLVETRPGATTMALGAVGVATVLVGYFAGGYVAGRMSRFDGGRQGVAVWVTNLLMTGGAFVLGLYFGGQYHLADRVDLPALPVPGGALGLVGLAGAAAVALGTLLAAVWGGKVGCRYHEHVDDFL